MVNQLRPRACGIQEITLLASLSHHVSVLSCPGKEASYGEMMLNLREVPWPRLSCKGAKQGSDLFPGCQEGRPGGAGLGQGREDMSLEVPRVDHCGEKFWNCTEVLLP